MKKLLIFLALLAGVAAFAISSGGVDEVVEWRVKSALVESGLSEKRAGCMAARMVDRLSVAQLRKLQTDIAALEDGAAKPTSVGEVIALVRRVGDAETVAVTVSSAGLCAIGIG